MVDSNNLVNDLSDFIHLKEAAQRISCPFKWLRSQADTSELIKRHYWLGATTGCFFTYIVKREDLSQLKDIYQKRKQNGQ